MHLRDNLGKMLNDYRRQLLSLSDEQLELFMNTWAKTAIHKRYHSTKLLSNTGDEGLDVAAFFTEEKFDGEWDNYQCKQYRRQLQPAEVLRELGKMFFHIARKDYSAPKNYYFVAPKGMGRDATKMLTTPSLLKEKLLAKWDEQVAGNIVENQVIPLSSEILKAIGAFEFAGVEAMGVPEILDRKLSWEATAKHFGAELIPSPEGVVPEEITVHEQPYVSELLHAYGTADQVQYAASSELPHTSIFRRHLRDQRQRFYDTEAFKSHFRDSTEDGVLDRVENDVYYGVSPVCDRRSYFGPMERVNDVLTQAALVPIVGPLAQFAHIPIKQGYCHHLANLGRLSWK